jgi:hypothetical protein
MDIVEPKKFVKQDMKVSVEIPKARDQADSSRAFQWMLFKPQAHAVAPFSMNQATRNDNTERKSLS